MNTETYKNFTTTLPVSILETLTTQAKITGKNKNDIITESVLLWNKKRNQDLIRQGYANASKDKEWLELSEIVINDYEF